MTPSDLTLGVGVCRHYTFWSSRNSCNLNTILTFFTFSYMRKGKHSTEYTDDINGDSCLRRYSKNWRPLLNWSSSPYEHFEMRTDSVGRRRTEISANEGGDPIFLKHIFSFLIPKSLNSCNFCTTSLNLKCLTFLEPSQCLFQIRIVNMALKLMVKLKLELKLKLKLKLKLSPFPPYLYWASMRGFIKFI